MMTDIKIERQKDKKVERQIDRKIERQKDKRTNIYCWLLKCLGKNKVTNIL